MELETRIRKLEAENTLLRADNQQLRRKLGGSSWRADGRRGEQFVADLIGAKLTSGSAPYDLISPTGVTFEVKCPNLNEAVVGQITSRWSWPHILGANRCKSFDRLLLLGPMYTRYQANYADPESPFVIFDIAFEEVLPLLGSGDLIQISTAPLNIRNSRVSATRRALFTRYQTSRDELVAQYILKKGPARPVKRAFGLPHGPKSAQGIASDDSQAQRRPGASNR